MTQPRAFIFLDGEFEKPARDWPERPSPADLVVGADGGGRHLAALGWPAHALVGDFDSLPADLLASFRAAGAEIFPHPPAKDETDFELALNLAVTRGYRDIDVLAALGGRWDMTFGNLLLPSRADLGRVRVRFRQGAWVIFAARGPARLQIEGETGDLLSLMPLGGDVGGAALSGCLYPLRGETLRAGFSRGLSNALAGGRAVLSLETGTLLVMHRAEGYGRAPGFPVS